MKLGLGLGLGNSASASFDPASLFGGSDTGLVLDFTDFANLYQSTDTSLPVTAAGQTVKRATDLSGKGNHVTEATNGPTARDGYAEYDGTNDVLTSASLTLTGTDKFTILAKVQTSSASAQTVVRVSNFSGSATVTLSGGNYTRGTLNGSTGTSAVQTTGPALNTDALVGCILDLAGATATDEVKARLNSAEPAQTVSSVGPAGGGTFSNGTIGISSAATPLAGRIYRILVISRALSGSELAAAEAWAGA